jgi:uncharacterized protein (DUF1499 family)
MGGAQAHLRRAVAMARRRIAEEPASRLAVWARRFALFSLTASVLAVIIVRSGLLEIVPALATFAAALLFAALAVVLAFGAFIVIWREGLPGLRYALAGLAIGIVLMAYPLYLGIRAYRLPAIADITTDPLDPPRFDVIARLRPRGSTIEYAGLFTAEQQRAAYPDIEPLLVDATLQAAFETALDVVTKRKWLVVDQRPPQAGRRDGRIEAVARTPIMGFRDDIVVRVRPNGDGARIDIRSASRYGRHDLGTNAARVRSLSEDIDDAIASLEPEKPPRPTPAAKGGKGGQPARGGTARR